MNDHEFVSMHHELVTRILSARDMLEPILSGEIKRGHCVAGERECYGGKPGVRKTTLADARKRAGHATALINKAVNDFDDWLRAQGL